MKTIADATREHPVALPGGAERRVLSHGGKLMLVEFRFPAGAVLPAHSHPHEQVGYVVSGELDLFIDGMDAVRLQGGCSYYVQPNVGHHAEFRTAAVVVDCFTPMREDYL